MFVNSDALEELKQMTPSIRVQKNPQRFSSFSRIKKWNTKRFCLMKFAAVTFQALFFFSFGFRGIAAERLSWCGTDGSDK